MTTTLLAIDDSRTMRKVLEITFAGEDYRTVLADSADDALSKLRSEQPVVALVDALIGGTDGYELCRQLKTEAPQLGVIILSSKHQPYDRTRGGNVGADDFMDKPFDTQQLLDKVAAVAKRAGAAQRPIAAAPRAQTLSYGTPSGAPVAPAPVVAVSPAPVRPAAPRVPSAAPARPPLEPRRVPAAPNSVPVPVAAAPSPMAAHIRTAVSATAAGLGNDGQLSDKLSHLGLDATQVQAVLSLSREIVEQVVWEVVPSLAETLIREEIQRLTRE